MASIDAKVLLKNAVTGESDWIRLPFTEEDLAATLKGIGIDIENGDSTYDNLLSGEEFKGYEIGDVDSAYITRDCFNDIYEASDLVESIEALDNTEFSIFEALTEIGRSAAEAADMATDGDIDFYPGSTLTELAQEFVEEGMISEEVIRQHIDFEGIGRDLVGDGYKEVSGGVIRLP